MWIKAVCCTKDTGYAKRLARFLDKEYGNKIELNLCSSLESVFDILGQYKIDIVLFGDEFSRDILPHLKDIPCTCAFLTEQARESVPGAETQHFHLAQIEKFQRGDEIYKEILDAYSAGGNVKRLRAGGKDREDLAVYVFTSADGGCGTSTVARAFAQKHAAYEKVMYLDFGLFTTIQVLDGSANVHGMDEIIFALKSRRNILPLKLMSAVACTEERFYTFGSCSNGLDLLELNAEDVRTLISGLCALGEYQKVVVDIGTAVSYKEIEWMKSADVIVYVMEESDIGRQKYEKFRNLLENAERKEQMRFAKKIRLFRNKVRREYEKNSVLSEEAAGWAPYVSVDSYAAVADRIARSDSFSGLERKDVE